MKLPRPQILIVAICLSAAPQVRAQGTFQNLDFESATLVPAPGNPQFVQFSPAFPGWTAFIGGVPQSDYALYNTLNLDSAGIGIIDSGFSNPFGQPGGVIQGNYTAVLMAGIAGLGQPSDATLAQTGVVPAGTESLLLKAHLDISGLSGSFAVTLGGETLSLMPVGTGTNYILYAADIQQWAGKTAELDFTVFAQRPHIGDNYLYLDSIEFSDQPVPEPGTFSLFAMGALVCAWRCARRKR